MLRFCFFTTTLYLATSNKPLLDKVCRVDNPSLSYPECTNQYMSICSTGDFFANKVTSADENFEKTIREILKQREVVVEKALKSAQVIVRKLISERYTILQTMTSSDFDSLLTYFNKLIDASAKTESHNLEKGACGESAKASIANSLLKQLETGDRETVQLIELTGTPILNFKNSRHVFVIYNSQPIASQKLSNNAALDKLFKNLQPINSTHPVVTCDSWAGYHATPDHWLRHIQHSKDHAYGNVEWQKIEVMDYSIPSLRNGVTSQQRKFLISLMKEILRSGVNSANNLTLEKTHRF